MAKKYIVGNPRELPEGVPVKSRIGPNGAEINFYEGDAWYPGPKTTKEMIAGWVKDGSLIEVTDG